MTALSWCDDGALEISGTVRGAERPADRPRADRGRASRLAHRPHDTSRRTLRRHVPAGVHGHSRRSAAPRRGRVGSLCPGRRPGVRPGPREGRPRRSGHLAQGSPRRVAERDPARCGHGLPGPRGVGGPSSQRAGARRSASPQVGGLPDLSSAVRCATRCSSTARPGQVRSRRAGGARGLVARDTGLEVVWTTEDGAVAAPAGARAVPRHGREWYEALARSRYVVMSDLQGVADLATRPGQTVLQTWHGVPVTAIGLDDDRAGTRLGLGWRERIRREAAHWDLGGVARPGHHPGAEAGFRPERPDHRDRTPAARPAVRGPARRDPGSESGGGADQASGSPPISAWCSGLPRIGPGGRSAVARAEDAGSRSGRGPRAGRPPAPVGRRRRGRCRRPDGDRRLLDRRRPGACS